MARPTKQGIDFFSLDCNVDDKTELYLMETGPEGWGILVTLWQLIYSNHGYFIRRDDDLPLLIKRRVSGDINAINSCINSAIGRNLFDRGLHDAYQVLTSKAIQKRYFEAAKKKKQVIAHPEILLIPVSDRKNVINVGINPVNSSGNATKEKEKEKEKEYKTITPDTAGGAVDGGGDSNVSDYKTIDQQGGDSDSDNPPCLPPVCDEKPSGWARVAGKAKRAENATQGDTERKAKKPKKTRYDYQLEHYQLAVWMSNPVKRRFPSQSINLEQWADAVRKLITLDGYDQASIERIWRYVVEDERPGFCWSANCRSPMKLREKKDGLAYFEIIQNQMNRNGGGKNNGTANQSGGNSASSGGRETLQDRVRRQTAEWAERQGVGPGAGGSFGG